MTLETCLPLYKEAAICLIVCHYMMKDIQCNLPNQDSQVSVLNCPD